MRDQFPSRAAGQSATEGFAITPDDDADLEQVTNALWIGTGGDVAVVMLSGATVTLANVADGALLPIRVQRVLAATTAEDIVGLV